ncbi:uncharacterized protein N7477_004776 [Penicillium maclennaniae]|uniref:uncharacterized protein n=1 Tax=Penicillium maclennaniae TaxID=1343394 RepID=UPI0025414215|nr:uncharacterized protein N7477_004776 [Penicillium maclennaniae]KAJ5674842.1 hypothetical protein N7477_004776 [Penicillium maclennaniae]
MASHPVDRYGPKLVEKTGKLQNRMSLGPDPSKPAGGYDATPLPQAPSGYTVKFTFHRGDGLPMADFASFSSDPYVYAQLLVDLPPRHKQDPLVSFRTPTVRKDLNPVWNSDWVVANVPASGFTLKAYVYDEDPADHDDKLGIAFIEVPHLSEDWPGFKEKSFNIKKRFGSKRVYVFTNVSAFATGHHQESFLIMSIEVLGKTAGDNGGQMYTVGPLHWFKHFSPLIGRLTGTKDQVQSEGGSGKALSRYKYVAPRQNIFQAIRIQLMGPVPCELYHRYVEFKPFVAGMFQAQSLRGRILHKALHHQHQRIYNFDRSTLNGSFPHPCREFSKKFLEFAHYGQGGRIFTYVLTLDGQLRFTETGKEFGIDMLSKHTMHSDVSIYIAYSGEFFLRQRKHRRSRRSLTSRPPSNTEHAENNFPVEEGDEAEEEIQEVSPEPSDYELFIDNDSGTYRPNAEKLPLLREFLALNFPGLHITTLDCQADAERMGQMKEEQRNIKKEQGHLVTYLQQSSASSLSISSSDEEELNERSGETKERGDMTQKNPRDA